jgi:hypothetical protein
MHVHAYSRLGLPLQERIVTILPIQSAHVTRMVRQMQNAPQRLLPPIPVDHDESRWRQPPVVQLLLLVGTFPF